MSFEVVEVEIESQDEKEEVEYFNKYLNARPLNIYRMSTAPEVDNAVKHLLQDIGYTSTKANKAHINMRMLVCDLYHNYIGSPKRYLRLNMSKAGGRDTIPKRYNPQGVGFEPLSCCIKGLIKKRYIIRKKGYFNKKFKDGYQTRIRARKKLIELLRSFSVRENMIVNHPNVETILMRSESVDKDQTFKGKDGKTRIYNVRTKKLVGYDTYEDKTKIWRNTLRAYNELLNRTYIDVDLRRYPDPGDLNIDLSEKANTRRIFTNNSFNLGGRFYGGFWQSLPEKLRERIILDGDHVKEIDYSGMMVHILYALKGMKVSAYNLEPYFLAKDDFSKRREVYKKLLVVAANIDLSKQKRKSNRRIFRAVKKHIKKNPSKYPIMSDSDAEVNAYLKDCYNEVLKYHHRIADLIGKGEGLRTQCIDSNIAYKIISRLTKQKTPILAVHDSFICKRSDYAVVYETIIDSYVSEINSMLTRNGHAARIEPDEVKTSVSNLEEQLPYYMTASRNEYFILGHPLYGQTKQMYRQAVFKKTGKTNFNVTVSDVS